MTPTVLSLGGGVNSVAVLTRWLREGHQLDRVVFADTGEEQPGTHAVVAHARTLCEARGVPLEVVRKGPRLVDWYRDSAAIPFVTRRSCTDNFKIRPIRRHLRALGYTNVVMLVGFAWDEVHRVRDSDVKWIENRYPLIEWRWTRQACEDELRAHWDGPPVGKSGCLGCPLGGRRLYAGLLRDNPGEFARWRQMEESGRNYPHDRLLVNGPTLAQLQKAVEDQTTLAAFAEADLRDSSCGGVCFT